LQLAITREVIGRLDVAHDRRQLIFSEMGCPSLCIAMMHTAAFIEKKIQSYKRACGTPYYKSRIAKGLNKDEPSKKKEKT
jgi:hypothetical protein